MNSTLITTLLTLSLLSFSCKKKAIEQNTTTPEKNTIILKPVIGQKWIYEVELESFTEIEVPNIPSNALIRTELKEDGYQQISYKETRLYKGTKTIRNFKDVSIFEILLGDTPVRKEFSLIEKNQLKSIGFQQITPPQDPIIFNAGITIFDEHHLGGEIWQVHLGPKPQKGKKSNTLREFKTLGRETISTPLNTYESIHVQATGAGYPHTIIRDLWFVPRVGLVKEVITRFSDKQIVLKETKQLIEIKTP